MARPRSLSKENIKHDLAKAGRLEEFRIDLIDPVQSVAAGKMGISPSNLSEIERGIKPISIKLINRLIEDHNLNLDWLNTGNGERQVDVKSQPTAKTSLLQAHREIKKIVQMLQMMEARETAAWKKIAALEKEVALLKAALNSR